MRGPVWREKKFSLPDDFSKIDVTVLSQTNHHASGFPAVFHNTRSVIQRRRGRSKKLRIFALRGRNRHLLVTVMLKERSVVELKAFLA